MLACAPHVCSVPMEVSRGHQIAWNWSYSWLCAALWVLEIEQSVLLTALKVKIPSTSYYILFICVCSGVGDGMWTEDNFQRRFSDSC